MPKKDKRSREASKYNTYRLCRNALCHHRQTHLSCRWRAESAWHLLQSTAVDPRPRKLSVEALPTQERSRRAIFIRYRWKIIARCPLHLIAIIRQCSNKTQIHVRSPPPRASISNRWVMNNFWRCKVQLAVVTHPIQPLPNHKDSCATLVLCQANDFKYWRITVHRPQRQDRDIQVSKLKFIHIKRDQ